tara:strand:+ start:17236 stop:17934 length:699 start_codon:yes stop_codon:yes gene_type:complete
MDTRLNTTLDAQGRSVVNISWSWGDKYLTDEQVEPIGKTPQFNAWLLKLGRSYIGPGIHKADVQTFLEEWADVMRQHIFEGIFEGHQEVATPAKPKTVGRREYKRICKKVMEPICKHYWWHWIVSGNATVSEFRSDPTDFITDEEGREQVDEILTELRKAGFDFEGKLAIELTESGEDDLGWWWNDVKDKDGGFGGWTKEEREAYNLKHQIAQDALEAMWTLCRQVKANAYK